MPVHGMGFTLCDHPLSRHLIAELRDKKTEPAQFRAIAERLTTLLVLDATRDLATVKRIVHTPMETTEGEELARGIVAVPILRAGLGMLSPVVELFPNVSVGYIGMERDEKTSVASAYYCKLPLIEGRATLLLDPMIATGGTACQAIETVKKFGAKDIRMLSIVAAPEGLAEIEKAHPDVMIFGAALDRQLNSTHFILPGLGDFGDRLYGTE